MIFTCKGCGIKIPTDTPTERDLIFCSLCNNAFCDICRNSGKISVRKKPRTKRNHYLPFYVCEDCWPKPKATKQTSFTWADALLEEAT